MILNIKWRFREFPNILLTKDKQLWQMPFMAGANNYRWRKKEMKQHQGKLKYRINKQWITLSKLNQTAYIVNEKIDNEMLPDRLMPF